MNNHTNDPLNVGRRELLKAGAGLATAAAILMTPRERALAQAQADQARLDRIAGCTWPIRQLFKTRGGAGRGNAPLSLRSGAVAPVAANAPSTPATRDRTTTAE